MAISVSLNIGVTGLMAQQTAMDTASHNIANASTDGYSRQTVDYQALPPPINALPGQNNGLGVIVSNIYRQRDVLLDGQFRQTNALDQQYTAQSSALQQLQATLNEPGSNGIQAQLSAFFNSFTDLSSQPESMAARAAAVQQGQTLATSFNRLSNLLTQQRSDLDSSVTSLVTQVNSDATQVASLNAQIQVALVSGGSPNDLMDQRDLLLDKLSGLAGTTSALQSDGSVTVTLGGQTLVAGNTSNALTTVPDPANNNLQKVVWQATNTAATVSSGQIAGVITARDVNVTGMMTNLDSVASTVITAVNAAHSAGFGLDNSTGLPFFTGASAGTIGVNATLAANPQKVATSDTSGQPGNPNTATAIAGVEHALLMSGGTATISDYYNTTVATLGVSAQQAQALQQNQDTLVKQVDGQRQSVAGVSLDEEMTNLEKAQHAYQAAAQVIQISDTMLDTLINHTLTP
jgi:flagellar hook-associated protein 1 FlgK